MTSLVLPLSSNSLKRALLSAFGSNGAGALGVLDRTEPLPLFTFAVVRLALSFGSGGVTVPGTFSSGGVFNELLVSFSIDFNESIITASAIALSLGPIVAIGCRRDVREVVEAPDK